MRTTVDIQIGDCSLEVEISYTQGKARAYFGNGDYEDYNPTTVDIEHIELIEGTIFDLLDSKVSLDDIRIKCEDQLNQKLAA